MDKHIGNQELRGLVPGRKDAAEEQPRLSAESLRDAAQHVQSCADCARKVAQYRKFLDQISQVAVLRAAPAGKECPNDVDWYDVAAGLLPPPEARRLILHAALCEHCGPLLHAATSLQQEATPQEESFLEQVSTPTLPFFTPRAAKPPVHRPFMRWLLPASVVLAAALLIGLSLRTPLSGERFAELAANAHRQHTEGNTALEFRSDSQQTLNEWLQGKLPFSLSLPTGAEVPGEEQQYKLEGAREVEIGGKPAVYIAYRVQKDPVGLIVTPDSVADASGGVAVDYKKVSFHYRVVQDYKVVTWSMHGRTYALVSQEEDGTQRSCMVCHSAMKDRDLSHTSAPLGINRSALQPMPMWQ